MFCSIPLRLLTEVYELIEVSWSVSQLVGQSVSVSSCLSVCLSIDVHNLCDNRDLCRAGGHFSPHLDGPWVPREDESSVYTVIIYLNDDYEGGKTSFLSSGDGHILSTVAPKQGSALIFNHDTLHEGMQVATGTKYIVRTEIMFHRVDTDMLPNPMAYKQDKNYVEALSLYVKSHDLEQGIIDCFDILCY